MDHNEELKKESPEQVTKKKQLYATLWVSFFGGSKERRYITIRQDNDYSEGELNVFFKAAPDDLEACWEMAQTLRKNAMNRDFPIRIIMRRTYNEIDKKYNWFFEVTLKALTDAVQWIGENPV